MGELTMRRNYRRERRVGLDQVHDVVEGDVVVPRKTRQFGCDGRERRKTPERPVPVIGFIPSDLDLTHGSLFGHGATGDLVACQPLHNPYRGCLEASIRDFDVAHPYPLVLSHSGYFAKPAKCYHRRYQLCIVRLR